MEQALLPGRGTCFRCHRPWRSNGIGAEEHITTYSDTGGCFPLCEGCWSELTPDERLPYYAQLMHSWTEVVPGHPDWALESLRKWPAIEEAVLNGL